MDMLGFEVLAYLGMAKNNNGEICVDCPWDDVLANSGVCKSWREASIDYVNWIKRKIGMMPSQGFSEKKLKVRGFLSYLARDDRFWSVTTFMSLVGKRISCTTVMSRRYALL
jgi:hypothetical protein